MQCENFAVVQMNWIKCYSCHWIGFWSPIARFDWARIHWQTEKKKATINCYVRHFRSNFEWPFVMAWACVRYTQMSWSGQSSVGFIHRFHLHLSAWDRYMEMSATKLLVHKTSEIICVSAAHLIGRGHAWSHFYWIIQKFRQFGWMI